MSTCKLNLILTLLLAIAFLAIHLTNGQSDIYQYEQKPQQTVAPHKYCGKYLSSALQLVCNGVYNSMFKKSDREMDIDYPYAYDYPLRSRASANAMMGRFGGGRFRRESHGVYDECCVKSCTMAELMSYCGEVGLDEAKVSLSDTHFAPRKKIPAKLRVTTWVDPPFSWVEGNEGNYTGHGFAFVLFDALLNNLNLTYEIVKPTTALLDYEHDGIIKLLHEKEVDVAVAFLPILPELSQNCSYGYTLSHTDITVLLKRPKVSAVGSGLLAPFDTTVWLCILVSLIVVGPVIYVFTSYRSYLFDRTKVDKYTFTASVWFTYGALLKQGSPSSPIHDSNRLLFATWWLFITIITSFYTANLTAFLTLSEFTLPIKSVEDIVDTKTKWVAQENHIVDYAMKENASGPLQELKFSKAYGYGKFIKMAHGNKDQQIVDIVNKSNEVFLGEKYLIDKIIHDDYMTKTYLDIEEKRRCTLVMMPQHIYRQNRAFAYQLDSTVQQMIDVQLLHLIETGVIEHLQAYTLPSVRYCPLDLQSKERQLSNDDLSLTYKVIASGFAIAIFTFIIEMLMRWTNFKLCLCCEESCACCRERMESDRRRRRKIPTPSNAPFSIVSPKIAPIYDSLVYNPKAAKKHVVNGRDYWVITDKSGYKRLVPIRSPSAMLFQYTT